MTRDYTIRLRLSETKREALKKYAESRDVTMSEVLRDFVKTLISDRRREE